MDIQRLEKIARRVAGKKVKVQVGAGAHTDGETITVLDVDSRWPRLPKAAKNEMAEFLVSHEASHLVMFERAARKFGKPSVSAEEFYQVFADPLSPGADSRDYVRFLMNVVEDRLVDEHAAQFVGQDARNRVNRFFVWNRQGGTRSSLAEYEAQGNPGKCAAFVEAIFQLELYGELIESFYSAALESAARDATKTIESFGQGALSRQQALQRVLDALRKYCPPPWKFPDQYRPPKGEGAGKGGDPAANPSTGSGSQGASGGDPASGSGAEQGEGAGNGESQPGEQGGEGQPGQDGSKGSKAGDGKGAQGDPTGEKGKEGKGDPSQNKNASGQPSDGKDGKSSDSKEKEDAGDSSDASADKPKGESAGAEESDGETDPEAGSESQGGGSGSPSETNSRGAETGGEAGTPQIVDRSPERRFEDNNLEALLRMLERVLSERAKQTGRGMPRYRVYSPGDIIQSPEEITRWQEDEFFGIDPLRRRAVRRRDKEQHLIAVFIDSSGSVENELFSQLYRVCGELAEKIGQTEGIKLGVGQFSGGASWVLVPTQDTQAIRDFAEEMPKRLYSGGTTVGEIYGLLPDDFAGYESADLIVLTDGYVEDGKALATSLEKSHSETGCEIKLHGVVFKGQGSLKQFVRAKDELPEFVRTWHLGGD